MGSSPLWWS